MSNQNTEHPQQDGHGWIDVARSLHRHRKLVLTLSIGLPLLTAVVLLFTPNKYRAMGTILVETPENSMGLDFMGQLSALAGLPTGATTAEIYLSVLRSERVGLAVIDSLNLTEHYKVKNKNPGMVEELTLIKLTKSMNFDQPDFVTIHVFAKDKSPKMAASIVNATLAQLEKVSQTLAFTRARRTREMVEQALEDTKTQLEESRVQLEEFQRLHGVVDLESQIATTMTLIGELEAVLIQTKARREALQAYQSRDSGQLRKLDLEIEAMEKQITKLMGSVADPGEETEDYLLEMGDIPQVGGAYAELMMDLKVQEAKYTVLATRLEQTKIEESQSIPAFEVLDWAREPHKKASPKRKLTVLAALFSGVLASVMTALVLDEFERRVDPASRRELSNMLPGWLRRGKN